MTVTRTRLVHGAPVENGAVPGLSMITTQNRRATRAVVAFLLTVALSTASCGTLLYPERHGQRHGRIDPAVAVLDGVGLLVFLIPGLIAFGVDFATGAIYMPTATAANDPNDVEFDVVQASAGALEIADIEAVVSDRLGTSVEIDADTPVYEVTDLASLRLEYAKLAAVDAARID